MQNSRHCLSLSPHPPNFATDQGKVCHGNLSNAWKPLSKANPLVLLVGK